MPEHNAQQGKARPLTEVIAELHAELFALKDEKDDLEVLGLDRTADEEAVRLAYLELSKRYHPHRFARYRSVEASRLASEIYVCIQGAYGRVTGSHRVPGADGKAKPRTVRTRDDLTISRAIQLIDYHQYDAAEALLGELVDANNDNEEAWAWLYLAQARKHKIAGDVAAAVAAYRELLELQPSHQEALAEVERLEARGKKSVWARLLKLGG